MQKKETPRDEPLDSRESLGLVGILVWLALFVIVEYAHDRMMANPEGRAAWAFIYEVAAGYVLGFVAALSASIVVQLGRGPVPELLLNGPWMRAFAMLSLLAVLGIAIAGLVMHNFGGPTFTYDFSFLVGIAVVVRGVLPLYRRWRS